MQKLFWILVSLLYSSALFSQQEDSIFIKRVSDEILTNGKAYSNLRELTKNIGPRLAGSPGMVKAEQWAFKRMQESGADETWMQPCIVPHWERGGRDVATAKLSPSDKKPKKLDIVALGNSIGSMKAIQKPVIEVKDFDDLERKKDSINGKIVFYNYKFNPTFVNTFHSYSDAVKYRGQGPSRAAKYGAAAVIVRSISHSTDNNPHTGSTRYDSNYAKIPAAAIGLQDADWLSAAIKRSGTVLINMSTFGRFLPDTIGHNIIGELKGSEYPNEFITVGGHLDSWDNCEGAHDDGAGVVQTMEILRAFKALGFKPRRTIRFVLFANEENGLRGGAKYAEEAVAKGEKHLFALESDAGGFTPRSLGLSGTEEQYQKFKQWQPLIAPYGCSEFNKDGGGADIGPLSRALKTATGSLNPDSQRYFDIHHSRNDVFESVNKRELELGAVNMAALLYLIDKYGL